MPETEPLHDPWLIAAWPGMGSVAMGAGGYLVQKLGAQPIHEFTSYDIFDIQHVEVREGLAQAGQLPRNIFFEWRNPGGRHDLIIFIGEAQPSGGGYALCHKLLDYAEQRGVKRFFTFAAMATQLHPSHTPRVFAVATDPAALEELQGYDVQVLSEGQISGLNGVMLAAGSTRDMRGLCLLGELPFFAVGVPNPAASQAVLDVFAKIAEINLDLSDIAQQAKTVEKGLLKLLQKLKRAVREQTESEEEEDHFDIPDIDEEEPPGEPSRQPPQLDEAARRRIETLFEQAQKDRSHSFRLKEELDRLGAFEQYEDRFLDLFRKAQ